MAAASGGSAEKQTLLRVGVGAASPRRRPRNGFEGSGGVHRDRPTHAGGWWGPTEDCKQGGQRWSDLCRWLPCGCWGPGRKEEGFGARGAARVCSTEQGPRAPWSISSRSWVSWQSNLVDRAGTQDPGRAGASGWFRKFAKKEERTGPGGRGQGQEEREGPGGRGWARREGRGQEGEGGARRERAGPGGRRRGQEEEMET